MAGSVTWVVAVPPVVAANFPVLVAVVVRLTVTALALVVALPYVSSRVTVKGVVAELLEAAVNGALVIANWVPFPAVIASVWVPESRPDEDAVIVGDPAIVSP